MLFMRVCNVFCFNFGYGTQGPGRPNTVTEQLPLVVNIDCKDAEQSTDDALSLHVLNRILFTWY